MSPNELILSGLFQILLLAFLLPGLMMQEKPSPAAATPTYCIESHPDYDREKCETEDPLHHWRRLQEERVIRQSKGQEKDCQCPPKPEGKEEDPLDRWERIQCERACKDSQQQEEDPLHRWRSLQQENLSPEKMCEMCKKTSINENVEEGEEDPLAKWRKLQCERVCKDANQPKQD